jgi:hypothetical protein
MPVQSTIGRCQRPGEHSLHVPSYFHHVDHAHYDMVMLPSAVTTYETMCQKTDRASTLKPRRQKALRPSLVGLYMFKVWLSLSLLCRFDDRSWTRQARRVQKNSGERELSAASCCACFDFCVERARGCVSGVNSGPRFVTHEDSRARNNWRDPTERLGGPAVNAGRISPDRPSA